jgi:hypothetical protein
MKEIAVGLRTRDGTPKEERGAESEGESDENNCSKMYRFQ